MQALDTYFPCGHNAGSPAAPSSFAVVMILHSGHRCIAIGNACSRRSHNARSQPLAATTERSSSFKRPCVVWRTCYVHRPLLFHMSPNLSKVFFENFYPARLFKHTNSGLQLGTRQPANGRGSNLPWRCQGQGVHDTRLWCQCVRMSTQYHVQIGRNKSKVPPQSLFISLRDALMANASCRRLLLFTLCQQRSHGLSILRRRLPFRVILTMPR